MANNIEKQLKEISERLEQGVKEIFTSERYTEYLNTMSKFHNYSFNNTLLITMQKPEATLVAGYQAWQKKFNRHVKRGEKGIQIIAPAGAATATALPKTNKVLSNSERTIVFKICGFLYGGSSSTNPDCSPFNIVTESTLDITSVIKTQKTIIPINNAATSSELLSVNAVPAKNMSSNAIIVGNRPLHGIKLFVRIAISRSFGDSMILHPVTPQALQPSPIAIARLCFP